MNYTTLASFEEPDIELDGEIIPSWFSFHVDHIHKTDEIHFVIYNRKEQHDEDGYMLSREQAIEAARAILKRYGVAG